MHSRNISTGFAWLLATLALLTVAVPSTVVAQDGSKDETQTQTTEQDAKKKKSGKKGKDRKGEKSLRQLAKELPPPYRAWLTMVDILLEKEERKAFLDLQKDYQRDAFIERFWRSRDPYPQTTRNEFRERWEARANEALAEFGDINEDRSLIFMLNGPPDARIKVNCSETWPIEVWYYQRAENAGTEILVMFFQVGGLGKFRIWYPQNGVQDLVRFQSGDLQNCNQQDLDAIGAAMRVATQHGTMGFQTVVAELIDTPEAPSGEWVSTFNAYSTDLPDSAEIFPAELTFEFPGRHQSRTAVQALIAVETTDVTLALMADFGSYNFLVNGEILREGGLFDNFRFRFNIPADEVTDGKIPLVFERYLRPGSYDLILIVDDLNSDKFFRAERTLDVPAVEQAPPPPMDDASARLLAEANAAISTGETTIKIVEPSGDLHTGMLRVDTLTTGKDIAEVTFALDDQPVLTKRRPPYSVELDLGSLPRMRTLAAVALDNTGLELARDERELNAGSHRFDVRLIEPRRNLSYDRSLRAQAELQVPEGGAVERVEFYLNETHVATLYQPPWTQPMLLDSSGQLAYVRAVAYQPDGNFIEDTVFVNAPEYMENLEVQFVELYISVLDRDKHPVLGLTKESFKIYEDGSIQEPTRFDQVTNLPIHATILLDVSGSMEESIDTARRAALQFYQATITPKDRAALMTFNDHPHLAVKFTNELEGLAGGLAGLKAERGTALYDSLIFALYYFNGVKGQRALVLLSDGKDEHSRFLWEDAIEYARRAGVAIYTIGLNLGKKNRDARGKLNKLARETGGRSFFVQDASDLASIYATIQQELRSRYYLAYQSTNSSDVQSFRTIDVELLQPGLEAKTLRGYYP